MRRNAYGRATLTLGFYKVRQDAFMYLLALAQIFFVDPVERITMVFMTQLYPSSTYPIRRQLKTMIYSALTDSYV